MHPPKRILQFLRWFCREECIEEIEGDLTELFEKDYEKSQQLSKWKFTMNVLRYFRPEFMKSFNKTMFNLAIYQSHLRIGWRNVLRNKGYSFINVGGLAIGLAVALLVGLWISDELSFNRNHENYLSIAKVLRTNDWGGSIDGGDQIEVSAPNPTGLGTLLRSDYSTHFRRVVMVRQRLEERILQWGENKFTQAGYFMEADGPEMFSLHMVYGTRAGLHDMKSIILSESLSKKLFGDIDPVNEIIRMDAKWDLTVTGVYKDLPKNSEFSDATFFAPLDLYLDGWANLNVWDNYNMSIYVQLQPGSDASQVTSIIHDAMLTHVDRETAETKPALFLQPMSRWHLYSEFKNGVPTTSGQMKLVWSFAIIGAFVLLLACINFMNLSTARSEKRAKEVGIRKSIGSLRVQLIQQFFGESLIVVMLAFATALILIWVALPFFNMISDKRMFVPWANPWFWFLGLAVVLVTATMAGSYPAFYLSSFNPVKVLKGTFRAGRFASLPRRILVVVQFTVSITLIIATIVVYEQIQFAKNRPIGYNPDGLISLRALSPEFNGKYLLLREELKRTGAVEEMAEANYPVTTTLGNNGGFKWKGKTSPGNSPSFNTIQVTHEYGKTVGWEFIAGRDFSREITSDENGIIINESAANLMGLENPIGEIVTKGSDSYKIVGIVKDMVKESPFNPTMAAIHFLKSRDMGYMYIRINPSVSLHDALPKIEAVFKDLVPSSPFDYEFADQAYEKKFLAEERIGSLAAIFGGLAIFISCLGLLGLASFVAEKRTKEIGIRKVLGASISNLWRMLSKEFIILILISCVISVPLAMRFMSVWLQQYEYRTEISLWVFVISCGGAVAITLFTVSFHAIKSAMANPVESLKME